MAVDGGGDMDTVDDADDGYDNNNEDGGTVNPSLIGQHR